MISIASSVEELYQIADELRAVASMGLTGVYWHRRQTDCLCNDAPAALDLETINAI
jgi:hypothetical protein